MKTNVHESGVQITGGTRKTEKTSHNSQKLPQFNENYKPTYPISSMNLNYKKQRSLHQGLSKPDCSKTRLKRKF